MQITLTNNFHGTSTRVRIKPASGGLYLLSKRQAHEAWRKLCGVSGCSCGGIAGERAKVFEAVREESESLLLRI